MMLSSAAYLDSFPPLTVRPGTEIDVTPDQFKALCALQDAAHAAKLAIGDYPTAYTDLHLMARAADALLNRARLIAVDGADQGGGDGQGSV